MALFIKKDYMISQFDSFGSFFIQSLAEENRIDKIKVVRELGGYSITKEQLPRNKILAHG